MVSATAPPMPVSISSKTSADRRSLRRDQLDGQADARELAAGRATLASGRAAGSDARRPRTRSPPARSARALQQRSPSRRSGRRHGELLHCRAHRLAERLGRRAPFRREIFAKLMYCACAAPGAGLPRSPQARARGAAFPDRPKAAAGFPAHAVLARGGVQRLDARLDFAQRLRVQLDSRSVLAQGAHASCACASADSSSSTTGFRWSSCASAPKRRWRRRSCASVAPSPSSSASSADCAPPSRLEPCCRRVCCAGEVGPLALARRQALELIHVSWISARSASRCAKFSPPPRRAPAAAARPVRVATCASQDSQPACESTSARCRKRSSDWCSCWPWMSTRCSPAPLSCASVAAWPLMKQRERPARSIVRRRMTVPDRRPGPLLRARPRTIRHFEFRRELGALGAFAHQGGVATAADQELDRVDEDRLAGAGLAGERGEARAELERRSFDDDEVRRLERAQHAIPPAGVRSASLQRSFSRSVAK